MKNLSLIAALALAILTTVGGPPQQPQAAAAAQKKAKKLKGRLPNYYGRVGITKKQRQKIYSIQATYRDKLEALQQQIEELREKQAVEVEAVLTETQRKKVQAFVEAARKKREARKKKREADKEKALEKKAKDD